MKDNIERKAKELGISSAHLKLIIDDIFGHQVNDIQIPGLVDVSSNNYDKEVDKITDSWKKFGGQVTTFCDYFKEHKAPQIKNCTSSELRSIGYYLDLLYTFEYFKQLDILYCKIPTS